MHKYTDIHVCVNAKNIHMQMHTCIYICASMHVKNNIYVHIYIYICEYVCVCALEYVQSHMFTYVITQHVCPCAYCL